VIGLNDADQLRIARAMRDVVTIRVKPEMKRLFDVWDCLTAA